MSNQPQTETLNTLNSDKEIAYKLMTIIIGKRNNLYQDKDDILKLYIECLETVKGTKPTGIFNTL